MVGAQAIVEDGEQLHAPELLARFQLAPDDDSLPQHVRRGVDRRSGLPVIIKVSHEARGRADRIRKEIDALSLMVGVPGVVEIVDMSKSDGETVWIATPIVGRAVVDAWPEPQPPEKALKLALFMAKTLDHVHALNRVHNDVAWTNVTVDESGTEPRFFLIDFDVSYDDSGLMERRYLTMTHGHRRMPPEIDKPELLDPPKVDVYCLGFLMADVVGRWLKDVDTTLDKSIPWHREFERCIDLATHVEVSSRPNMADLLTALEFADDIRCGRASSREAVAAARSRRRWVTLTGAVVAVIGVWQWVDLPWTVPQSDTISPAAQLGSDDLGTQSPDARISGQDPDPAEAVEPPNIATMEPSAAPSRVEPIRERPVEPSPTPRSERNERDVPTTTIEADAVADAASSAPTDAREPEVDAQAVLPPNLTINAVDGPLEVQLTCEGDGTVRFDLGAGETVEVPAIGRCSVVAHYSHDGQPKETVPVRFDMSRGGFAEINCLASRGFCRWGMTG